MRNLLLAFILTCYSVVSAQQQEKTTKSSRPKVGLVLSGGGAKGFAHIGVLKVLEEAGVEISYIGGTSMGAIVGGLYASGYNASQIDSIFTATDFDALLQDYIPRAAKNFYGKRNDEVYAISLPFEKFRVGVPSAYSKGLYNYNLLTKLTHDVRHIKDFSKLPIPFLCIGTDIESGESVLLDTGYLPQAMLASAAFPSLFSPVEINGRLLVDGGVTNNYPIHELKKLGAEYIIGVDVQDDLKDRTDLTDATRILVQISNLQMMQAMKRKIAETDVYIKPDITDFSVISFDQGRAIIEKGEQAARVHLEEFKRLGTPEYKRDDKAVSTDSLSIAGISINPLENFTRSYVMGKLRFKGGEKISYRDLKMGIDNLSATQSFSSISYTLEKVGDEDVVSLRLTENPVRTSLRFGLHYDGLYKSAILANITQKKVFLKNDVASFDLVLGDNFRYNFDYYVDNGFYFSFGLKSRLYRFNRNVGSDFSSGQLLEDLNLNSINIDFSEITNQIYLQTIFIQKFMIGAGVEHKHLRIKSETIQTSQPVLEDSDYLSAFGYLKYDSYDNKYFPKRGWFFSGDFHSYLSSSDFTGDFVPFSIAKGHTGLATTIFPRTTLRIESEAGFAIGDESVPFFDFLLGGYGFHPLNNIRPFYGYNFLDIGGDSYISGIVTLDYEIFKKNHINFSANYANVEDNLFDDINWLYKAKYSGYALGYGLETIIGPVEIKYSWSPEHSRGFTWFSVGFWF
ncbi:MAG: patatin-like phospholipase family protein [Flavobacterium sp.]|nr:patatin-like phospholipase family protein [Flavobacterium sp.]